MEKFLLNNLIDMVVDMRSATLDQNRISAYNDILNIIEEKLWDQ
jgi:hypothetical protein